LTDKFQGQNVAIVCLYCDYRDRENQVPVNMMGSILRQLVTELPAIPEEIIQTFQTKKQRKCERLELSDASRFLSLVLNSFDWTFVCIDALDECEGGHRGPFLRSLKQLSESSMKLFITGRPHVQDELNKFLHLKSPQPLQIMAHGDDIKKYVASKIADDPNEHAMNEKLKGEIQMAIANRSQGM
jgi:hypothetical protein